MQPENTSREMSPDSCDPRDVEEVSGLSGAGRGPPSPLLILRNPAVLSGVAEVPSQIPVSHSPSLYIQKIAQPNARSLFSTPAESPKDGRLDCLHIGARIERGVDLRQE
jgi:hypothetical protein